MADLGVTWIAPVIPDLQQLAWLNELGRIQKINGVLVRTLTGDSVTRDEVAELLSVPCDVFIWSGHGTAGGLLLPDHTLVRTQWLATLIGRGCRPRLAILAACGSQLRDDNLRSLTEAICRQGINAVGFPADAGDVAAGRFTIEAIRALSVNAPIGKAFDMALESIDNEETAAGVFLTPGLAEWPFSLENDLQAFRETLQRIEKILGIGESSNISSVSNPSIERSMPKTTIHSLARSSGHVRGLQ